jgi:hypothetical protein
MLRRLNVSKETARNEKDLNKLTGGQIEKSRDDIYAASLRARLKRVAKDYGDDEILERLKGKVNEQPKPTR